MTCRHHVGLTSEQLAKGAYLTLTGLDDEWSENRHSGGMHLLGDLWERLMPEFCEVEGCGKARLEAFPTCKEHTADKSYQRGPWNPARRCADCGELATNEVHSDVWHTGYHPMEEEA